MKYQMKEMNSLRKARETSVFIYKFLELDPFNEIKSGGLSGTLLLQKPHFSKRTINFIICPFSSLSILP